MLNPIGLIKTAPTVRSCVEVKGTGRTDDIKGSHLECVLASSTVAHEDELLREAEVVEKGVYEGASFLVRVSQFDMT